MVAIGRSEEDNYGLWVSYEIIDNSIAASPQG
jgi:hypothetical protein